MISILSEKEIAVPELNRIASTRRGFNVIRHRQGNIQEAEDLAGPYRDHRLKPQPPEDQNHCGGPLAP